MRKFALSCVLLCLVACAGNKAGNRSLKGPPLTEEQAKSFDDGVDFVASVEGLEGRWREDWDRDLQTRVASATVIALVTVHTVRTDTDPSQEVTHRLIAKVDRELVGTHRGDIELLVREHELGFATVHENLNRITERQFIAYVIASPDGAAWHLSPASPEVVGETEAKVTMLNRGPKQNNGERVIVHTN